MGVGVGQEGDTCNAFSNKALTDKQTSEPRISEPLPDSTPWCLSRFIPFSPQGSELESSVRTHLSNRPSEGRGGGRVSPGTGLWVAPSHSRCTSQSPAAPMLTMLLLDQNPPAWRCEQKPGSRSSPATLHPEQE